MKQLTLALAILLSLALNAQTYSGLNITLVSNILPNTSTVATPVGNKYSGCWGWYQQSKNKEYAISGASDGTYFIDITNPVTPTVSAFVPGRVGSTWRELKTYKNYCYIVCDDSKPNTFQIVDMQYLPDSVHIVHNSNTIFERAHTLWVDSNRLYVAGLTFSSSSAPMAIYSLATPTAPVLLKKLSDDISTSVIPYVHDMYARNDTIFASAGDQGLFVLKYDALNDTVTILGSYANYGFAGYNHSSFLTKNGKYLMFCDEVPANLPIHMVDVQNPANIQQLTAFYPARHTTAHNPYLIGNNFAIVSCYQDGLYIFDISQPGNIKQAGYFDTFPQGGDNTGTDNYGSSPYNGNWGAYPYLPSGLIVANDMQNGVLILNPSAAYTTTTKPNVNAVGIKTQEPMVNLQPVVYPNPASSIMAVSYASTGTTKLEIKNMLGQVIYSKTCSGNVNEYINVQNFDSGIYHLSISGHNQSGYKKLQVNH